MAFVVGAPGHPVYVCSTQWVADLLRAELETVEGLEASINDMEEFKLHVDFGGMLSTRIQRVYIDHEDGEFSFYSHQRSGIREEFRKAIAGVGRDEYVKIPSQNHVLCVTPDHALQILFYMDNEDVVEMEREAKGICQEMVDSLRKLPEVKLGSQHDLNAN